MRLNTILFYFTPIFLLAKICSFIVFFHAQNYCKVLILQLICVGFNFVPNLIVILFNLLYLVFYVGFHYKGCVWERVWRIKTHWRSKEFSWVARKKPSCKVKQVLRTWLKCEKSWQMVTAGFRECLAGKAFLRDTCETFYFANLSYLIHQVSMHTIYTHITHILRGVLFREKTLAITLESERLSYPQSFTQSIVVFLNSYFSISKSLRGW